MCPAINKTFWQKSVQYNVVLPFLKFGKVFYTIIYLNIKNKIMGNILYIVAVILVIAWAIGFLGYHAGNVIHILLVIAVIAILLKVIRR